MGLFKRNDRNLEERGVSWVMGGQKTLVDMVVGGWLEGGKTRVVGGIMESVDSLVGDNRKLADSLVGGMKAAERFPAASEEK